jgi:membrane protease YdiL (CAAX protease family)
MVAVGTVPWALLAWANLEYLPSVPWSAPIVAAYLYLFWKYAGGDGWPGRTSLARRENRRANPVRDDLWGGAMFAGMLGLVTIVALMGVLSRMIVIPAGDRTDLSRASWITLLYLITASATVSGIVEEVSYRGYLQRPIERRFGFLVAVMVSGLLFGFAHFTHPGVGLSLLPYYLTVSAVYGGLACITDSLYPSMLLHGLGNFFGSVGVLAGRGDWSAQAASPAPTIWVTGPDAAFFGALAFFLISGAVTAAAFVMLARQRGQGRSGTSLGVIT